MRLTDKQSPKEKERKGKNDQPATKTVRKGRDVVLIKPNEGKTYADTPETLKLKVNLEDTQTVISTIRKTRDGGVVLELGKGTKDRILFRESIRQALGQFCQVRSMSPRITVEIRGLDSLATVDDRKLSEKAYQVTQDI